MLVPMATAGRCCSWSTSSSRRTFPSFLYLFGAESVRSNKISWVTLGQLAIGKFTQCHPTDFVDSTGQAAITCIHG